MRYLISVMRSVFLSGVSVKFIRLDRLMADSFASKTQSRNCLMSGFFRNSAAIRYLINRSPSRRPRRRG
jgi:hypothetical protein